MWILRGRRVDPMDATMRRANECPIPEGATHSSLCVCVRNALAQGAVAHPTIWWGTQCEGSSFYRSLSWTERALCRKTLGPTRDEKRTPQSGASGAELPVASRERTHWRVSTHRPGEAWSRGSSGWERGTPLGGRLALQGNGNKGKGRKPAPALESGVGEQNEDGDGQAEKDGNAMRRSGTNPTATTHNSRCKGASNNSMRGNLNCDRGSKTARDALDRRRVDKASRHR